MGTIANSPGNRSRARAAASSLEASSVSIRARSLSRWFRRGGKLSRSGSTKVATVVVSASRRAT